jgi:hypothetical protein
VAKFVGKLKWSHSLLTASEGMAGTTGLEPAASAVTGQRSNQLNYVPTLPSWIPKNRSSCPCSANSVTKGRSVANRWATLPLCFAHWHT